MVLHLWVSLPEDPLTPNNIGDFFKGPQRQWWKKALFDQYNKNKNVKLLLTSIPIKPLLYVTKVLCSMIVTGIKEGDCYGSGNLLHDTV